MAAARAFAASDASPAIEALAQEDLRPGCGCSFYAKDPRRQGIGGAGALLHWSLDEREWGRAKLDGKIRRLKLLQEKHFPPGRETPQYGDKIALTFQEDEYNVQAVGSVVRACAPKRACQSTGYMTRLILRKRGDAPREIDGWGECACTETHIAPPAPLPGAETSPAPAGAAVATPAANPAASAATKPAGGKP